jgi:F-type H+-transporting ATPase subunit epsilon
VHYISINHGFAEVTPEKTTILTDTAELAGEIDVERARAARTRAEEKLKTLSKEEPAYLQEMEALERARMRIRVSEKAPRE